jgi:hypothetical protein
MSQIVGIVRVTSFISSILSSLIFSASLEFALQMA